MRWFVTIDPKFIELSRKLRKDQTPWEKKLWMYLKNRKFYGIKFKRQVVMGRYIYDFLSYEKKLIIELDGAQHSDLKVGERDKEKENYAKSLDYFIIRFYNNDVQNNIEGVLDVIRKKIC